MADWLSRLGSNGLHCNPRLYAEWFSQTTARQVSDTTSYTGLKSKRYSPQREGRQDLTLVRIEYWPGPETLVTHQWPHSEPQRERKQKQTPKANRQTDGIMNKHVLKEKQLGLNIFNNLKIRFHAFWDITLKATYESEVWNFWYRSLHYLFCAVDHDAEHFPFLSPFLPVVKSQNSCSGFQFMERIMFVFYFM